MTIWPSKKQKQTQKQKQNQQEIGINGRNEIPTLNMVLKMGETLLENVRYTNI